MHQHAFDLAHRALSRGALRFHPILYVTGEVVMHRQYGPCEVLRIKGVRQRLIEYAHPLPIPPEKHQAYLEDDTLMWAEEIDWREEWVDIDELRWVDRSYLKGDASDDVELTRSAWLQTLHDDVRRKYSSGVDYAALRFERNYRD